MIICTSRLEFGEKLIRGKHCCYFLFVVRWNREVESKCSEMRDTGGGNNKLAMY